MPLPSSAAKETTVITSRRHFLFRGTAGLALACAVLAGSPHPAAAQDFPKGPMRITDVEEAQKKIMRTARKLADAGELMLGGGADFV